MTIEEAIPHRAPFLLVDEIVERTDKTIRTRKTFKLDDPVFSQVWSGHFPSFPLTPGVLVVEAILQTGAILIAHLPGGGTAGLVPVLTRLSNAKFKQMVRPGDTVEMEVEFKEKMANAFFMSGSARVGGKLAVSLDFGCAAVASPEAAR